MAPSTDDGGQLLKLRCHDGSFFGLEVRAETIELRFRRTDGTLVGAVLDGVCSFAMDRFLEGNIVDTVYLWTTSEAPASQRRNAAAAFSCDEALLDCTNKFGADKLFVLESSYGATIYALVREVRLVE